MKGVKFSSSAIVLVMLTLVLISSVSLATAPEPIKFINGGVGLMLDKADYRMGEDIHVLFSAPEGLGTNAWIGIIPANIAHGSESVNDQHDLTYQYIKNRKSDVMTFVAPRKPGLYDIRMHNTDNDGVEIAFAQFRVLDESGAKQMLRLKKTIFSPGEEIEVAFMAEKHFKKNAWIGILPSNIKHGSEAHNDKYELTYQYIDGKLSGVMKFKAPAKPGKYDFRMHDRDDSGKEVAYVSFLVK